MLMILAIGQTSLDGPAGTPSGAPTFTVVTTDDGQLAARVASGYWRSVDPSGTVTLVPPTENRPGAYEKFILDGPVAVYRPRQDLPDSPAFRYAATKVPGGG